MVVKTPFKSGVGLCLPAFLCHDEAEDIVATVRVRVNPALAESGKSARFPRTPVWSLTWIIPRLLVPVVGDQDEAADVGLGPERIGRAGGQKDAREEGPCAGHFSNE